MSQVVLMGLPSFLLSMLFKGLGLEMQLLYVAVASLSCLPPHTPLPVEPMVDLTFGVHLVQDSVGCRVEMVCTKLC